MSIAHQKKKIYILSVIITLSTFMVYSKSKRYTVMLSPTGHAQETGRALSDGFERGATRQLAEAIKKKVEENTQNRVILTHNAGEVVTQEQKASFANRLDVDLYIALTIYNDDRLSVCPYYYKDEPFSPSISDRLAFYPIHKAYLQSIKKTEKLIKSGLFPQKYQTTFKLFQPTGLPIKLLEGITAPAFTFEISIKNIGEILTYVDLLADTIRKIIDESQS